MALVSSLLKRDCDWIGQSLSERVRRLSERVLPQKKKAWDAAGKRNTTCMSNDRWCAKEDALPDFPLVIRDSQCVFTAAPQCVAEQYAQEWTRE